MHAEAKGAAFEKRAHSIDHPRKHSSRRNPEPLDQAASECRKKSSGHKLDRTLRERRTSEPLHHSVRHHLPWFPGPNRPDHRRRQRPDRKPSDSLPLEPTPEDVDPEHDHWQSYQKEPRRIEIHHRLIHFVGTQPLGGTHLARSQPRLTPVAASHITTAGASRLRVGPLRRPRITGSPRSSQRI